VYVEYGDSKRICGAERREGFIGDNGCECANTPTLSFVRGPGDNTIGADLGAGRRIDQCVGEAARWRAWIVGRVGDAEGGDFGYRAIGLVWQSRRRVAAAGPAIDGD